MPLIECPDCGKRVSDQAPACIGCGRPMQPAVRGASTVPSCPHCNQPISPTAKVCKHCNRVLPSQQPDKRPKKPPSIGLHLGLAAGVMLVIAGLALLGKYSCDESTRTSYRATVARTQASPVKPIVPPFRKTEPSAAAFI